MDRCENLCSLSMAWWCYVGGMEWGLFSIKRDAYGDIYGLHFSLYGNCIAYHSLHWQMELCRKPMISTVPVQYHLLGIMKQLHTLLGMKARDMALPLPLPLHLHYDFWMRSMFWSIALGDIGKKWYLTNNLWWLISSFMQLYYLIRYVFCSSLVYRSWKF